MERIKEIRKLTDNRYLNMYEEDALFRDGSRGKYYFASRRRNIDQLKAVAHDNHPDGVILYGVHGENKDKVVLVRQFRYPINGYVYEFPAGLVEPGEDALEAGVREMYEETGLSFTPIKTAPGYFTSVGMTDESCGTVFGYCSGEPSVDQQEGSEDIQVVLADREECKRILKEENVAIMCAYMLMHFVASEGDPLAFLSKE